MSFQICTTDFLLQNINKNILANWMIQSVITQDQISVICEQIRLFLWSKWVIHEKDLSQKNDSFIKMIHWFFKNIHSYSARNSHVLLSQRGDKLNFTLFFTQNYCKTLEDL